MGAIAEVAEAIDAALDGSVGPERSLTFWRSARSCPRWHRQTREDPDPLILTKKRLRTAGIVAVFRSRTSRCSP
jgi:hypothetical protein